MHKFLISFF